MVDTHNSLHAEQWLQSNIMHHTTVTISLRPIIPQQASEISKVTVYVCVLFSYIWVWKRTHACLHVFEAQLFIYALYVKFLYVLCMCVCESSMRHWSKDSGIQCVLPSSRLHHPYLRFMEIKMWTYYPKVCSLAKSIEKSHWKMSTVMMLADYDVKLNYWSQT